MSITRAKKHFLTNKSDNQNVDENNESSETDNEITYGAALGVRYALGKFEYIYHAHRDTTKLSLKEAIKVASHTGLKGLGVNVFNNLTASFILNATIYEFDVHEDPAKHSVFLNNTVYAAIGGLAASIATYPPSIIEARRYEGQSFKAIRSMNPRLFFNGMPAAGISDCLFNGIFFGMQPLIHQQIDKQHFFSPSETDRIADFTAGIIAGFACNPLFLISNCQKMSSRSIAAEARSLFMEGGVKRFYRGFSIIGLMNVGLFALTQGSSFRLAEQYLEQEEKVSNKIK